VKLIVTERELTGRSHPNWTYAAQRALHRQAESGGMLLTGMGSDGMLGARLIREYGGSVLAQDQATSTVWGMPGAVTQAGLAHKVLPLDAIASEILRLTSRTHSEARELRESVV